ncbi:protein-tyrosine phosphatase [Evansella caseinilytica]|uniref:Tyrosine-protein phosphatase n=1 Tax=Evansella caseinilytica TaxID=1503961 RepID=A0A1H3ULP1_9BACI|nr:CpsB/CapC family capsule biosynthesis tyrosine phosphatase [Evansella caseinilytica]SDZ63324.1 protein-tyrosine phosphatase [Evansella caseinilytica]
MIDIHCHILPELDDGAKNINEAIEMAAVAVSEGIHTIIATPHHNNGAYYNPALQIRSSVAKMNDLLEYNNIDLKILPGQEIRIYGEILEDFGRNELLTLNDNSKYFLLELPYDHIPRYTSKLIYEAQLKGYLPIIVHPERNHEFYERPDLLYHFVKNGALTQITAGSITGQFGYKVKKFTEEIIKADLTHFLASDAHNLKTRSFHMQLALEVVERKTGAYYRELWQENAMLLLAGEHPYLEQPKKITRTHLFSFLRG